MSSDDFHCTGTIEDHCLHSILVALDVDIDINLQRLCIHFSMAKVYFLIIAQPVF